MRIYIHKYIKSSTVYSCLYIFIFEEILEKIFQKKKKEILEKILRTKVLRSHGNQLYY